MAYKATGRAGGGRGVIADDEHDIDVTDLQATIAAQEKLIRRQSAALSRSRKIFERASEAARIGVWECRLPDQFLTWTDVIYDIFDLPRGHSLSREDILSLYTPASAAELKRKRDRAIKDGTGFTMDAEIITRKGNRRFVRITATVEHDEGQSVRLFGMKQDITEEKLLLDRTRYLAECDVMTGLANRSRFQTALADMSEEPDPRLGVIMLIDLDGFKSINDTYGHVSGDECLSEAAARISMACASRAELVARIGGDEFAVLFDRSVVLGEVCDMARQVIEAFSLPIDVSGSAIRLGASIGLACTDGSPPGVRFVRADNALYAAKRAGRNTYRIFKPEYAAQPKDPRAAA